MCVCISYAGSTIVVVVDCATRVLLVSPLVGICHSVGCCVSLGRLLCARAGRKAGLYPSDADTALFVDEMISTVYEVSSSLCTGCSVVCALVPL